MLRQRLQEETLRICRFEVEKLDEGTQMLFGSRPASGIAQPHGVPVGASVYHAGPGFFEVRGPSLPSLSHFPSTQHSQRRSNPGAFVQSPQRLSFPKDAFQGFPRPETCPLFSRDLRVSRTPLPLAALHVVRSIGAKTPARQLPSGD